MADKTDNWNESQEYEDNPSHVTKEILELKLNGLKSDLRLLILASVALNQVLSTVTLPKGLTVAAISAAILAPIAKGVWFFFSRTG